MLVPYARRLSAPEKEIRRLTNCLTSARSCALKCPSLWASCGMICVSGLGWRRTGLHRFHFFQLIIRLFGKWVRGHGGVPDAGSRAHTPKNRVMKPKKSGRWNFIQLSGRNNPCTLYSKPFVSVVMLYLSQWGLNALEGFVKMNLTRSPDVTRRRLTT